MLLIIMDGHEDPVGSTKGVAMRTLRNLSAIGLLTIVLLTGGAADPNAMSCYVIEEPNIGGCAPGGQEACTYFDQYCEYYCFTQYGNYPFSYSTWTLCQEENQGDESNPSWCTTQGNCKCWVCE